MTQEGVARAPGKLVLSGSYSVLWGAPAIVTAVSRYAIADKRRPPVHVAEEVHAAVRLGLLPFAYFVDASALRTDDGSGGTRKLGLGSSAAILVASLVAYRGPPADEAAKASLFADALAAHRQAQGGGSGLDVAASTWGGTRRFAVDRSGAVETNALELPSGLRVAVFSARTSAVTSSFVARVRTFAWDDPSSFDPLMDAAKAGAAAACDAQSPSAFVAALATQRDALERIGRRAGVAIVGADVVELGAEAARQGAFFGPSGAGGGDVAFWAAEHDPTDAFVESASRLGYDRLQCDIGAQGAGEVEG